MFCAAASCNADVYGFLSKWMRDMRDSQHEDGSFPGVAPVAQYGNTPHELGWADAGVIVSYTMWRRYGDRTIIDENWDAVVRFVDAVSRVRYTNAESCQRHQWADWLSYVAYETRIGKVDASFDSPYGMIRSAWSYGKDGSWTWNFTIPPNTTAIVAVPGGKGETLGPGTYMRKVVPLMKNPV